jgi:hypothetical protein
LRSSPASIPSAWPIILRAMNSVLVTDAGTEVYEPSAKEYAEYLEARAQALAGMSVAEFKSAYEAGDLDDADPGVSELVALLRIGQNGRP